MKGSGGVFSQFSNNACRGLGLRAFSISFRECSTRALMRVLG